MGKTTIAWTDFVFNGWEGCTKVSAGCAHCYAETRNARFGGGTAPNWGKGAPRRRTSAANWKHPLKWNSEAAPYCVEFGPWIQPPRPRVFCASLADWLDDEVPIEWLASLLGLIRQTPFLDWLLLSKRLDLWGDRISDVAQSNFPDHLPRLGAGLAEDWFGGGEFPANVWLGTSVEDQAAADLRIPQLLQIPAKVRFLSCEPLLGPIEFSNVTNRSDCVSQLGKPALSGISWIIIGGESGHKARLCNVEWIRSIVQQCRAAGVAPFVKQMGSKPVLCSGVPWSQKDPKGGDPSEWFADLRVQEFPQ